MANDPTHGKAVKLAYDATENSNAATDFDGNSLQWEFLSESLANNQTLSDTQGIRGTVQRVRDRVVNVRYDVGGSISMVPTPVELDTLFYLILGTPENADSFVLAEDVPYFSLLVDRGEKRYVYGGCKVNRAVFQGSSGNPLQLTLDLAAKQETIVGTSWPGTIPAIDTGLPYTFDQVSYANFVDASAAEVMSFTLTIDRVLDTDQFNNSLTRTSIDSTDLIVTLEMLIPLSADTADLVTTSTTGTGSTAPTLTFTGTNVSTVFTFGHLKAPQAPVTTPGRNGKLMIPITYQAYKSTSSPNAAQIAVTHDSNASS